MIRALRALVPAILLVGALSSAAVQASPVTTPPPDRITLGSKVLVVKGSKTATIPVRVNETLLLDAKENLRRASGPNPSVKIEGDGRFVGLVIVRDPYEPGDPPFPFIVGRFRQCSKAACTKGAVANNLFAGFDESADKRAEIPPGDYKLYLITDGAPASVQLTFDNGAAGRRTLKPSGRARVDLQSPNAKNLSSSPLAVWAGGNSYQAGNVGFSFTGLWMKAESLKNVRYGICELQTPDDPPEEVYGPQCSALSYAVGTGHEGSVNPLEDGKEFFLSALFGYHDQSEVRTPHPEGRVGFGTWATLPGGSFEEIGSTTFFVEAAETWRGF